MLPLFYLYSGNDLIEPPQVDLRTITLGVPPQEVSVYVVANVQIQLMYTLAIKCIQIFSLYISLLALCTLAAFQLIYTLAS